MQRKNVHHGVWRVWGGVGGLWVREALPQPLSQIYWVNWLLMVLLLGLGAPCKVLVIVAQLWPLWPMGQDAKGQDPMYCVAQQAPLSMEFSKQEYWNEWPFLYPGIEPRSPALQADSLPSEPPGKPPAKSPAYPHGLIHGWLAERTGCGAVLSH